MTKSKKLRAISHDDEDRNKKEEQIALKMNSFFMVDARSRIPYKFPHKLFYIVDSGEYSHIVQWNEDGDAFQIKNEEAFVKDVLLDMFKGTKGTKFPSFHRKLNRWKFSKVRRQKLTWRHPLFKRNRIDLCSHIKEGSPSTLSKIKNKESEQQDLHEFEPLDATFQSQSVHPNYYQTRQCQDNLEGLVSNDTSRMNPPSQSSSVASSDMSSFRRDLPSNMMNIVIPSQAFALGGFYPPLPSLKGNVAINMTPAQSTNAGLYNHTSSLQSGMHNVSLGTMNFVKSSSQDDRNSTRINFEKTDTDAFVGTRMKNALSKLDDSKRQGIDNPCPEQTKGVGPKAFTTFYSMQNHMSTVPQSYHFTIQKFLQNEKKFTQFSDNDL